MHWKPSTGKHRNEFLGCLRGTVFMNLSDVNKLADQTILRLVQVCRWFREGEAVEPSSFLEVNMPV